MKNLLLALTALIILIAPRITHAQDFWIDSYDGIDVYIVEETIVEREDEVTVTTKNVHDGKILQTIDWFFEKFGDQWRYETSEMDSSHTSVVIDDGLSGAILRFCIDHLD